MRKEITYRLADFEDIPVLEDIRSKAFKPIFNSFRNILGGDIYSIAQEPEDKQQSQLLSSMLQPESVWQLYVVEYSGEPVGFVSIQNNRQTQVGEIGLNAIHPDHAGKGIGTEMYQFAFKKMKESGMRVATVSTGDDISHAPARHAYKKAGFNVQIPSVWMCKKL